MCKFNTDIFTLNGIYFFLATFLGQFLISGLMLDFDEGFRIFKLFSFENQNNKTSSLHSRNPSLLANSKVVLKLIKLKCLKIGIQNNCHGSICALTLNFHTGDFIDFSPVMRITERKC